MPHDTVAWFGGRQFISNGWVRGLVRYDVIAFCMPSDVTYRSPTRLTVALPPTPCPDRLWTLACTALPLCIPVSRRVNVGMITVYRYCRRWIRGGCGLYAARTWRRDWQTVTYQTPPTHLPVRTLSHLSPVGGRAAWHCGQRAISRLDYLACPTAPPSRGATYLPDRFGYAGHRSTFLRRLPDGHSWFSRTCRVSQRKHSPTHR